MEARQSGLSAKRAKVPNRRELTFASVILMLTLSLGWPLSSADEQSQPPKVSVKTSTSIGQLIPLKQQAARAQDEAGLRQQRSPNHSGAQLYQQQQQQPAQRDQRPAQEQAVPGVLFFSAPVFSGSGKILDSKSDYQKTVSSSWSVSRPTQPVAAARAQTNAPLAAGAGQRRSSTDKSDLAALDFNCQRRSMGRMLRSAKNLLTDGIASLEQYTTPGNVLMLGSSLLAAAIPLAAFALPETRSKRRAANDSPLASQSDSSSSESALVGSPSRLQGRVESVMGWIERSVQHLPNFPHLHPQECVKRSICEAHYDPDKYGAIGFMLRLLFPASNLSSTDRMDNMEFKVINKYRHAAGYGLHQRLDTNGTGSSKVCKEKYEDCIVSLLDVAQKLMDTFLN